MMLPRGGINLPVVIAAALGVGFGASAFLNIAQYNQAQQEKKLLRGEITDLRYQVQQDRLAAGGSPSPSPEASESPSPSPTPSATPEVAGASTVKTATMKAAANVRSDASANSVKLISMLAKGTSVTLGTDKRNGYQQITVNGITGYVLADHLQY